MYICVLCEVGHLKLFPGKKFFSLKRQLKSMKYFLKNFIMSYNKNGWFN